MAAQVREGGESSGVVLKTGQGVHCWAGLVGFNASHPHARMLLSLVHLCAQDAECIAPLGANLSNHRYEQAALSVSAHLLEVSLKSLCHLLEVSLKSLCRPTLISACPSRTFLRSVSVSAHLVADPREKGALLHLPLNECITCLR